MKERKQALGSLIQIESLICWDNEFDIVLTQDSRCYVYREQIETDRTQTFEFLMKQASRNLVEEDRLWKMMNTKER
jgi:hypothetical protein